MGAVASSPSVGISLHSSFLLWSLTGKAMAFRELLIQGGAWPSGSRWMLYLCG